MARSNFVQTSFRQGEWSPFSQGRIDEDEYYAALNICADFQPVDAGALVRRSGSKFVATIDVLQGGTTPHVQLIPFDTDAGNHYVGVLTPENIQFFENGTFTLAGDAVAMDSISSASDPAVFTTQSAHGLSVGDLVAFIAGEGAGAALSKDLFNVQLEIDTVPTSTTFTASYAGARATDGAVGSELSCYFGNASVGKIAEVVLPFTAAQLVDSSEGGGVKHTQDSDYLYLFNKNHEPNLIDKDLALIDMAFADGPYYELNEETTTLTLSGTTGSVTVTASATTGINGGTGFVSTDVGRHVRFQDTASNWTWLVITAVGSTTSITATIEGNDAGATTAVTTWRLGLYSDTTGWPTHGVFHELRLWLISDAQTKRIDGSNIILDRQTPNGAFRFSPTSQDGTVADRHSPSYILNSQGRNRFNWLSADDTGLLGGTSDGIWIISASAQDDPLTPTSIQARRKSRFKSADKLPTLVNRSTVFIGDLEKEVIEIRRYQAGYDAKNVSRDGEHLLSDGLEEILYANAPIPTLWGRTSAKRLIGASFRRDVDGEQTGWHQHNMEYTLDPTKTATEGNVEAITVVKQSDKDGSNIDTLWMVNERNGFYCLEYMTPLFDQSRIDLEGFFVDGGMVYDTDNFGSAWSLTNAKTNEYTFYGLHHLEGNTVDMVWRTLDLGQSTVSNGAITVTIPKPALALPSSYSTYALTSSNSWTIGNYAREFVTGLTSSSQSGNMTPPMNGAVYLTGEDGETYYLTLTNALQDTVLVDKNTGTETTILTLADYEALVLEKGMDPTAGLAFSPFGGTESGGIFVLPGTSKFVTFMPVTATGLSPWFAVVVFYWQVNSPTDIVSLGGYIDSTRSSYVNVRGPQYNLAFTYLGNGLPSNANDFAMAWGPLNGSVAIARFPSVSDVVADGYVPWVHTTSDWSQRVVSVTEWGQHFGDTTFSGPTRDTPTRNRLHFLPTSRGGVSGVYLAAYRNRDFAQSDIAGTLSISTTYSLATATEYPDGYVTAVVYTPETSDVGPGGTVGLAEILNCRIQDGEANSIMPFADSGFNHLDVRDSAADDYWNPSVYPTDPTDHLKPWLLFYPKTYYSAGTLSPTGTYADVRVLQWNPVSGTASQLEHLEGSLFDINAEFGVTSAGNVMENCVVAWDHVTGKIELILSYDHPSIPLPDTVAVASFGTLLVDADAAAGDIVKLEALNRGFDATIGLNYVSRAQLLRPQRGSNGGPDLGKTRRVDQFAMIMHRTGPFKIGTSFDDGYLENVTPDETILETGQRPLYTGVIHGNLADDYGFNGQIAWEMDRPGPGSYLAVGGFRNTQDR